MRLNGRRLTFARDRPLLAFLTNQNLSIRNTLTEIDLSYKYTLQSIPSVFTVAFQPGTLGDVGIGTEQGPMIIKRVLDSTRPSERRDLVKLDCGAGIPTDCMDFHPSGRVLITAGPSISGFLMWDVLSKTRTHFRTGVERVTYLSYSPCGSYIVTISDQIWVMIWSTHDGSVRCFGCENRNASVISAAWSAPNEASTHLLLAFSDTPKLLLCVLEAKENETKINHLYITEAAEFCCSNTQGKCVSCIKTFCWDLRGCRLAVMLDSPHPRAGNVALFKTTKDRSLMFMGYINLHLSQSYQDTKFVSNITCRYSEDKKVEFAVFVNNEMALFSSILDASELRSKDLCLSELQSSKN